MHKSIVDIHDDLKTFFQNEMIDVEHSLVYEKYSFYEFCFSKKIAYFLENLTGLPASSMLQQYALSRFDNFLKSTEPNPKNVQPKSTISILDKEVNIEISVELTLKFNQTDGWHVTSYGSNKSFEEIYSLSLDLITFHRSVKTFKDLKMIRCSDKYKVFNERINNLNMNMYTKKQCLSELDVDNWNPLNVSDLNKVMSKIFSVEEQHIFKQIFALVNFSSNIIGKELKGTQFNFSFETDHLNLVLANNKYFWHDIYSMTFYDLHLNCMSEKLPYIVFSVIDEPEKFALHYSSKDDGYTILKFYTLNDVYNKILELYRKTILDELGIELDEFNQSYFELYQMSLA